MQNLSNKVSINYEIQIVLSVIRNSLNHIEMNCMNEI